MGAECKFAARIDIGWIRIDPEICTDRWSVSTRISTDFWTDLDLRFGRFMLKWYF